MGDKKPVRIARMNGFLHPAPAQPKDPGTTPCASCREFSRRRHLKRAPNAYGRRIGKRRKKAQLCLTNYRLCMRRSSGGSRACATALGRRRDRSYRRCTAKIRRGACRSATKWATNSYSLNAQVPVTFVGKPAIQSSNTLISSSGSFGFSVGMRG